MRIHTGWFLACFMTGTLCAGPANGLGLTLGGVSGSQGGIKSSGLSLGGDAQFAANDLWTLNPFLMVSFETISGSTRKVSDNLGGIQFRRWFGPVYCGPQLFFHDRLFYGGGSVQSSQYGPGVGAVVGWEGAGGFSVGAQVDALEGQFLNSGDRRNAVRAYIGYRWR
jgi:hypothetical protein